MTAASNSEARKRAAEAQATSWVDRHGDVWRLGDDGLLHTPETAPFSREHVEKKWGPLRPVVDLLAALQDSIDATKAPSNSESAALATNGPDRGDDTSETANGPQNGVQGSGIHDIYCEGGRCRCFSAVDSEDVGTIPAPVDSGAIGRLNEAEKDALALSLWDAGLVRPESLARAVVDHIDNTAIVREHTDRALAEAWDEALRHAWALNDPAYTVITDTESIHPILTRRDVEQATNENPYRAARQSPRCPGCGHTCCPHPGLECDGESDAVGACDEESRASASSDARCMAGEVACICPTDDYCPRCHPRWHANWSAARQERGRG